MTYGFESLAVALLTLTNSAPTLCEAGEQTVLYGQVQDDFGFDVAVCTVGEEDGQTLTIRWVGEGGGSEISCMSGECDGRIEYSRYTSPNQTILTLAWREDGHVQRITQVLSRADLESPVETETRHSWQPAGLSREDALEYPVETEAGALALMELETMLENKPWTAPLLAGEQK